MRVLSSLDLSIEELADRDTIYEHASQRDVEENTALAVWNLKLEDWTEHMHRPPPMDCIPHLEPEKKSRTKRKQGERHGESAAMTTATTFIAGINPPRIRRASIPTHAANPQPDQHPHPRRASAVDHQIPEKDAEPEEEPRTGHNLPHNTTRPHQQTDSQISTRAQL